MLSDDSCRDELSVVKRQLRRWESSFLEQHGRPPAKDDLTPLTDITALYNQYAQLKRRASSSSSSSPPSLHRSLQSSPEQSPAKQSPLSLPRALSSVLHGPLSITRSSSIASRPAVHRTKSSSEFGYRPISNQSVDSPTKPSPPAQSVLPAGSDDDTMHADFMRDVQRERQRQLTRSVTTAALHMVVPSAYHTLKRTVSDAITAAPPSAVVSWPDTSTPVLSTYAAPPAEPLKLSLSSSPSSAACSVGRTSSLGKRVSALPVNQPSAAQPTPSFDSARLTAAGDSDDERPLTERLRRRKFTKLDNEPRTPTADTQQPKPTTKRSRKKRSAAETTPQPAEQTHTTTESKQADHTDTHPPGDKKKSRKRKANPDGVQVSHNYVRINLKRKTKSYSRSGQSANSLRQQKYRERRGWKTKAEWKQINATRNKSIQDALYIELVDPAVVHRLVPSGASGRVGGGGGNGYDTDDDLAALAALEEAEKRQCESIVRRDAASLGDADLQALLHHHFGFSSFRPFQLECVTHILSSPSSSSLLILPTAAGKSLCYLLPALVLPFTLVVSPLLSLMSDQCRHLPPALKGAYWSSASTFDDSKQMMRDIRSGSLRLLFVSPEKALSPSFTSFLASLPSPPSLLVVDEAHCISHWSHNFRPSYLRLGALRERCERVLLMTGTATREREEEMRSMMAGTNGREVRVMREGRCRDELKVRMLRVNEEDKERQLLAWIKEWKEREKQRGFVGRGAIVYVNTREQADRYAAFLTSHSYRASAYHAGLTSSIRSKVQSSFLSTAGTSSFTLTPCPIVVATIAFGMGIDKSDVGLVLHTYVPSCVEMYAQEIGRAGRDGRESDVWCCWSGEDEVRARSWVWRDGVERGRVRVLLRKVMDDAGLPADGQPVRTRRQRAIKDGGEGEYVALNVEALQQQLNLTAEVAVTLLSHLQLSANPPCLHIVNTQHDTARITFRRPLQEMQLLAASSPLVTHVLTCSSSSDMSPTFDLSLCDASNALGESVVEVQRELLRLRALGECTIKWEHESVIVRLNKAVTVDQREVGDGETERESHVTLIMDKQRQHEERNQQAVELIIAALHAAAATSAEQRLDMHELMQQYFDQQRGNNTQLLLEQLKQQRAGKDTVAAEADWSALDASIGSLLSSEAERQLGVQSLAAKGIALVLHGLHTLSTPASVWGNSRWWGKWKHVGFKDVEQRAEVVVTHKRAHAQSVRE